MSINLISLSGRARVGKGTFVTLLSDILSHQNPPRSVTEIAFAHALKEELNSTLIMRFGISAFTTNDAEKKIIRSFLVARGAGARAEDVNHWVKLVEPNVKKRLSEGDVVIISDSRYKNECDWVHSLEGKVVYIERTIDGIPVPPANEEEAANDDAARAVSDITVSWNTFGENYLDMMRPFVFDTWAKLNQASQV